MNRSERIVFGTGCRDGHALIPEVLEIGWGRFAAADAGHLAPHVHHGAFEICAIQSGEVEWSTADSTDVLRQHDIYLTQPDELHWGRDSTMHPCSLYWVILAIPEVGMTWPQLDPSVAGYLYGQLREIRVHGLRGSVKLSNAFKELFDEHAMSAQTLEPPSIRKANARAILHRLLINLARSYRCSMGEREAQENPAWPAGVREFTAILHRLSPAHGSVHQACASFGSDYRTMNELFVEHLGITLSQYWLRRRVRMARDRLLNTALTVTEVSAEFGFSSSQHFATVFRRMTGLSPTDCRHQRSAGIGPVKTQNLDSR